jgi:hypothetical protein
MPANEFEPLLEILQAEEEATPMTDALEERKCPPEDVTAAQHNMFRYLK